MLAACGAPFLKRSQSVISVDVILREAKPSGGSGGDAITTDGGRAAIVARFSRLPSVAGRMTPPPFFLASHPLPKASYTCNRLYPPMGGAALEVP